jgi:hypothetical protein
MKQYFTLVQAFQPTHRGLGEYLEEQGIEYSLGADRYDELKMYGFYDANASPESILKTFKVLIDEHELSAIKLSVDGVHMVQNRSGVKAQNKVRSYFSWFLD